LAPEGLKAKRLIVMASASCGDQGQRFPKLGALRGTLRREGRRTIVPNMATGAMKPDQAAAIASGLRLRAISSIRYKTKKKEGEREHAPMFESR